MSSVVEQTNKPDQGNEGGALLPLVLITRPQGQTADWDNLVRTSGGTPLHFPLLDIYPLDCREVLASCSGIGCPDLVVATSAQSFFLSHDLSSVRDVPLYCVGEGTAKKARSVGFSKIMPVEETVTTLIDRFGRSVPDGARILYLRGEDVSVDLVALLPRFVWIEAILYRAVPRLSMPDDILDLFPRLHTVTLFSKRAAEAFAGLVRRYELEKFLPGINLLSVSVRVLESVSAFDWRAVHVPSRPDRIGMQILLTYLLRAGGAHDTRRSSE